ncbi:MAG: Cu(I)-responsive transcriptional regulator [Minwuia sp.]|uniref:Cu(I)-responsive transcriptional regulator n=1 Tax=Minwuia sp. TaxID=2493630 RepID=UPI003A8B2EB2
MNIGDAARASGLPTKTVRYYADIGLVSPSARRDNGYRDYSSTEVQKLRFVQRARGFGFSIEDCRELLALYEDRDRASADVKAIALERLDEIDAKMAELQTLRDELSHLAEACSGDARPDCPILKGLSAAS